MLNSRFLGRAALCFASVVACALMPGQSWGQTPTNTWTATSTGNWSAASNWDTNPLAPTSGATTILQFNASTTDNYTATNDILNPFVLNGLLLNSTSTNPITIAGFQLNFSINGATNPVLNQNNTGAVVISNDILISNPLTIGGSGSGLLTLNGVISGGALTMGGAGTVILGGNNTFTGGLTINSGVVQLNNAGALNSGTPQAVTFGASSTGTLRLNGNSITISGLSTNATPGTTIVENASVTSAVLTVSNAVANTFAGTIQDGSGGGILGLTKIGVGTLTLSGANTYTGLTQIQAGAISINTIGNVGGGGPQLSAIP